MPSARTPPARKVATSATRCSCGRAACPDVDCAHTRASGTVSAARSSTAITADLARAWRAPMLQSMNRGDWRDGMLETIAIILIVLWLLGLVSGYTMGNFIYVLLVIAIVLFLVRLISGRRVV